MSLLHNNVLNFFSPSHLSRLRGDTLVEVAFAIAVFCLVAIISLSLMSSGVNTAETTLETTMARNEMDAQAEAIRFIHNSYVAEREVGTDQQTYNKLWAAITNNAVRSDTLQKFNVEKCSDAYGSNSNLLRTHHAFVVNTRNINRDDVNSTVIQATNGSFYESGLYPRIIYGKNNSDTSDTNLKNLDTTVRRVEGLWVIPVFSETVNATGSGNPEYYDFHIRTCWNTPGRPQPTTIATIIRLYNPTFAEGTP